MRRWLGVAAFLLIEGAIYRAYVIPAVAHAAAYPWVWVLIAALAQVGLVYLLILADRPPPPPPG